jgi:hypothetical protein
LPSDGRQVQADMRTHLIHSRKQRFQRVRFGADVVRHTFLADADPTKLAALGRRTLLLCGDHSPKPMQRLVHALYGLMPESTAIAVSGAGHLLPLRHVHEMHSNVLNHLHAEAERRLP